MHSRATTMYIAEALFYRILRTIAKTTEANAKQVPKLRNAFLIGGQENFSAAKSCGQSLSFRTKVRPGWRTPRRFFSSNEIRVENPGGRIKEREREREGGGKKRVQMKRNTIYFLKIHSSMENSIDRKLFFYFF